MAEATGLPIVHLDAYYWKSGWVASTPEEWSATVAELASRDSWIMDGNYGGTMDQRFEACDAVVFLDVPRLTCIRRLILRRLRYRGGPRPEMVQGCPERLSLEFLLYVWHYPMNRRPGIMRRLQAMPPSKPYYVLKTPADADNFIQGLRG